MINSWFDGKDQYERFQRYVNSRFLMETKEDSVLPFLHVQVKRKS
jgi:hypothetical protein